MDMLNDVNFWRQAITVGAFALFLGITFWAYSRKRKTEFSKISDFVVQDDDSTTIAERSK
ncbi:MULTISPECIES: CcoQ/FixQ family Cbb3-type cytochrome c oxidase assembly chaperone [unclassified Limnobacter]|jgi:cbb3-type cytochrome oxidase subunit 3|uniref:CcoQ/FixQ family Cbb3-type cytochrome c oxidase assembly chaperone n=1 Tax=unclassified Limnobacter TaxID=2630203 RepID=UPI000C683C89|nr:MULTISPECIES: CcoQ/FixQ family Cbb3-type cytochrome c oxidase assembly chaperone [unclassified Limnobacter]MAZ10219.1 CcoQ/FixQ family Cbb3-type cytochrome c oxidase assembly chaperone [Sutterellaceae bacterium]|tara:strand:- start:13188 stop:13367 length:180 start_codon:yes stop_codon:yes gene_type:complete